MSCLRHRTASKTSGLLFTTVLGGAGALVLACSQQPEPASPETEPAYGESPTSGYGDEQTAPPAQQEPGMAPAPGEPGAQESPEDEATPPPPEGPGADPDAPGAAPPGVPPGAPPAGDPSMGPAGRRDTTGAPGAASPYAQAPQGTTGDFNDDKVDAFAQAYLKVTTMQQQFQQALQRAQGRDQALSIEQAAGKAMTAVVEEQDGISVQEFQAMSAAVDQDPELRQRVESSLREHGGAAR